jgi:hypothetical protein
MKKISKKKDDDQQGTRTLNLGLNLIGGPRATIAPTGQLVATNVFASISRFLILSLVPRNITSTLLSS